MIDKKIIDMILDFVRQKPRTIQEISKLLQKNWRTAERYVDKIIEETGLIAIRTFREGTKGALKIAFWNALEKTQGSAYQQRLLQLILQGRHKEDFSSMDIYQFIPKEKREAFIEHTEISNHPKIKYDTLLGHATKQVLFFSGNLSWLDTWPNAIKILEKAAKKGISIKIITRVDIVSQKNIEKLLNINQRTGKDAVQIRYCEQPLRALIIDDSLASLKEVLTPAHNKELKKNMFMYYVIEDAEWISWLQKVFWQLWGQSIDAQTRIDALKTANIIK